jgi:putative phage-type endonuclease
MKGIGGSEMAAILGLSPWAGPHDVWARKTGRMPEQEDNFRFKVGRLFEAPIAQLYADREKVSLARIDGLMRHPTAPIVGTPDRLLIQGKDRGLEIKTASWKYRHHWGEDEYTDDIPAYYLTQVATYMLLTGLSEWDVAVMFGFQEQDFRIYRVKRDMELEEMLIDSATTFWSRFVLGGEEPAIDGTDGCTEYIKKRYPKPIYDVRDANETETEIIASLVKARGDTKYAEAVEGKLENQVKAAIGEAEGIWSVSGKFTWKRSKDRPSTDWEKAASEMLVVIPDAGKTIIEANTKTKEGSRTFRYSPAR